MGNIISESIFGGIPFEGLETNVYNEVPAIFFRKNLLDLEVTLFRFPTGVENGSYHLQLIPNHNLINEVSVDIDISYFLYKLIQQKIGKIIEKIVVFDHSEY